MEQGDEKRKFIRYNLHAKGSMTLDGQTQDGIVTDISIGGIFLQLDVPLSQDDVDKECEAVLCAEVEDEEKSVEFVSRIVRVTEDGVGLFFVDMTQEGKDQLHDIIVELRKLKK